MNFQNKVVWITGASSGIGEALVYAFSKQGAKVALSARREEELNRVAGACSTETMVAPLDVTDYEAVKAASEAILQRFGHLDILINNAGLGQRSLAEETDLSVEQRLMEVNFFGAIYPTKAVLPSMIARREGHIVVVTSVLGKLGTPMRSGYAASKHALHGYYDCLRAEVWKHNLKVTLVCPGWVQTNISRFALKGDGSEYQIMDEGQSKGISADLCAEGILRGIAQGKEEFTIGGIECLGVPFKRLLPGLFSKYIRKAKVT